MQRELRKLDREIVICFEFLDTPGDEITPGSDKVRKHFENERFGHSASLLAATVLGYSDSTVHGWQKSKGYRCLVSSS